MWGNTIRKKLKNQQRPVLSQRLWEQAFQSQPSDKTAANSSRNIVKESAEKSLLNTKKGKAVLKVKKKIMKKNRGDALVINEGSRNGEGTNSAEQENKKETETLVEVSNKIQSVPSEQETGKKVEMLMETSVQAKAKASDRIPQNSIKARTKLMKKGFPKIADAKAALNKVQNKIVKKNKKVSLILNEPSGTSEGTPNMQSKEEKVGIIERRKINSRMAKITAQMTDWKIQRKRGLTTEECNRKFLKRARKRLGA
ncbi:hypothetical protein SAY87_029330 [Trapa incisa]|uniref:Uncharacterized protein n=1 Tax=Trapa incisa TaxID=236973 RepID=A0AAN7Q7Z8_9MYRT|nr:hypothetical protein SAY87_029330 [Trapa incisa]